MMTNKMKIRFRVYDRPTERLVLLWDGQALTERQKSKIELAIGDVDGADERPAIFKLASEEEIRDCNLPKGLMMAVIDHKENNLDPKEPCGVKLILGNGNDMIVESLRILPAGTLPMTECDNRYRNAHLYLFNDKINKWQKAIGEEDEDGRFRLLVSFK